MKIVKNLFIIIVTKAHGLAKNAQYGIQITMKPLMNVKLSVNL